MVDEERQPSSTEAPQSLAPAKAGDTLAPAAPLTDQEAPSPAAAAPDQEAPSPFRAPQTDEEWRQVLGHDRVREHLDRLTQSRADRLLTQQRKAWEQQQEQLQQQRRVEEMDDEELGRYVRENTKLSSAVQREHQEALRGLFEGTIAATLSLPDDLKLPATVLDRAEYRKIVGSAAQFPEMVKAVVTHLAEKMAEHRAGPLAEKKAKALFEDYLAKEREKEHGPTITPGRPANGRTTASFLGDWNAMTSAQRRTYRVEHPNWKQEIEEAWSDAESISA